jgi:hypothetical protein
MDFWAAFQFFSTGYGVLFTMVIAGWMLTVWDWPFTLPALILIQLSAATLLITFHAIPQQWMFVQLGLIIISSLLLAFSAGEARFTAPLRHRNTLGLQLIVSAILVTAWWMLDIDIALPVLNSALRHLFVWLAVVALVMLGMANDPMSVGIAILLWCIPIHGIAVLFTPIPVILALFGLMELALSFACAYLIVVDRNLSLFQALRKGISKTSSRPLLSRPDLEQPAASPTGARESTQQRLRPSQRNAP